MGLLKEMGVDLGRLELQLDEDKTATTDLEFQARQAADKAWGEYWPARVKQASGIYELMAKTVWQAARALNLEQMPRLGLFNGFSAGMINYEGYCWEENGAVWVGLDEGWFNGVVEGGINYLTHRRIREVLAEEVFHDYVGQVRPELAEENSRITQLGDKEAYQKSPVEQAAKEFARWYAAVSN